MPAGAYAAAVRFFGETLGLEVPSMLGTPWNWPPGTATGSSYSAGYRHFEFYRSHGASIVPLLKVDDLDQASAELAGGAELLGGPESEGTWTRLTFRVPEGNIHSLGARMACWQIRRLWSNGLDVRQKGMSGREGRLYPSQLGKAAGGVASGLLCYDVSS